MRLDEAMPIRRGALWLAETTGGRQLEIVEKEGGLHVCLVSGSRPPYSSWSGVEHLYSHFMRDPIVRVLADDGSEWVAT